jgi:Carboxypeptidase regulatory-like domain
MAQAGRVRIRVTDASGAVVSGAEASLLGSDGKPKRTVKANAEGEIVLSDLPIGDSRLRVIAQGFYTLPLTVTVHNADEIRIEAKLVIGTVGTTVFVEPVQVDTNQDARPLPILDPPQPRAVLVPIPSVTPVEVAKPSLPKRRWWHIFR